MDLRHKRYSKKGNASSFTVTDGFNVSGMYGGEGGDCNVGMSCQSDADCESANCTVNMVTKIGTCHQ